jgi:hypothetical protein
MPKHRGLHAERHHGSWPHLLALCVVGLALCGALHATRGLNAPAEIDHYRDIGSAQTWLDGDRGADSAYRGEIWWYPPLLPIIQASISRFAGISLETLQTRGGAYVNLLGPVALYALGCALLGPWPALCSLIAFLFVATWSLPSWSQATYGPWMWPLVSLLPLFCLTTWCWARALSTGRRRWDVATGLSLGVTFLGHAAPAIVLAAAVVLVAAGRFARGAKSERWRELERTATIGLTSLVVSAPLLLPLTVRYHLHVLNPIPGRCVGLWGREALAALLSARGAGAAAGAAWLFHRRRSKGFDPQLLWVLGSLLFVTGAFFAYGVAVQRLATLGIILPLPVPAFHFHYYFTAVECLLFGIGAYHGLGAVVDAWAARRVALQRLVSHPGPTAALLAVVAVALLHLPSYVRRDDFVHWPNQSRKWARDRDQRELYLWARNQATRDDVILVDDHYATFSVVAAGRKVVAVDPLMSSPYVAVVERGHDRDAMFEALCRGDRSAFRRMADKYAVTYVASVSRPYGAGCPAAVIARTGLPLAYQAGSLSIFAARANPVGSTATQG